VVSAIGMSSTENPARAASAEIASSARMLPSVCRLVMITPMVWKRPLLSARAAPFGR
jgi:hypothetical protein